MMDPCALAGYRSQAYWLLSRLMCEAPTAELLTAILESAGSAERIDKSVDADLARLRDAAYAVHGDEQRLSELAAEFTRLFGGISARNGLPPVESAVREGRALGESAAAVAQFYAEAGYPQPCPEAGPMDHLATELRFLAFACYSEARAWRNKEQTAAREWLEREQRFLDEHVLAWAPHHCAAIAARTKDPFYAALAKLIARSCMADGREVRQTLRITRSLSAAAVPPTLRVAE